MMCWTVYSAMMLSVPYRRYSRQGSIGSVRRLRSARGGLDDPPEALEVVLGGGRRSRRPRAAGSCREDPTPSLHTKIIPAKIP